LDGHSHLPKERFPCRQQECRGVDNLVGDFTKLSNLYQVGALVGVLGALP
jgi:hypothetical protein